MTIYGPFNVKTSIPMLSSRHRIWYRQKPITSAPLEFSLDHRFKVSGGKHFNPLSWASSAIDAGHWEWTALENKLYEKLIDKLKGDTSAWAANLATWKQSHGMIVARATQLLEAVWWLKKGRFKRAASALGIRAPRKRHARDLAGQWLELSYGWIPLIQDIHNSVDILQRPLPDISIKVFVSQKNEGKWGVWDYAKFHRRMSCGCKLRNINHVPYLASQMGLVNPATVLWEVIPFSFVIDWFVPVGRFLESFTDFIGLDLYDKWTTKFGILDIITDVPGVDSDGVKRCVQIQRRLVLPSYRLRPRFTGFNSMRGANAIALLIGGLKSLR